MTTLEKIAKNLYKMFRDEKVKAQEFTLKFQRLKEMLASMPAPYMDSEYHRSLKSYIDALYERTVKNGEFDDTNLDRMREEEKSRLNRLQKTKLAASYKKEKHKRRTVESEWE